MQTGLYEQIINKLILSKLDSLDKDKFFIKKTLIDKNEAAKVIARYLTDIIQNAFNLITGEDSLETD